MNLLKLSNFFNAISQAHTSFNYYHFGWRSDMLVNIPNNFDPNSSTGKLFPAVHFAVPESFNSTVNDSTNKDSIPVTLYFDNLQDYNNNGTANTKTLLRQWSDLTILAKEYLYNVQRLMERDLTGFYLDTDSFRLEFDSDLGADKLISVKATFNVTVQADCINVELEPTTLTATPSSLYPVADGYDYEDLYNLIDVPSSYDRCQEIYNSLTPDDIACLQLLIGGGSCDWNDCTELLANITDVTKNTCVLPTYDFSNTDVQSNVTTQQQTDLEAWLCDYNDCPTLLTELTDDTKNTCILPTYDFTTNRC